MLKRLADQGLVEHVRYHGTSLTPEGRNNAVRMIRRHRIIEAFLVDTLGYSWDRVHDEAERLEHAASDELIDRIAAILGEPDADPHGAPIPSAHGAFEETQYPTLAELSIGRPAVLRRVHDEDPEALRFLAALNLRPGANLVVLEVQPFNGPLTVRIDGHTEVLGREIAGSIQVEPID
jgi:DtxR family Mn-dependent transcriptional regulator